MTSRVTPHLGETPDAQVIAKLGQAGILELARRYIWWKEPGQAITWPLRVVRQVMNIGTFEDMQAVANALGDKLLSSIVETAEAGEFNARSWHYWHYRLGLSELDHVPPMPQRKFA